MWFFEEGRVLELRFHGRGGQGAITAAQILAEAAFLEGRYAQSFPFFGGERRGAPVTAFTRIADEVIEIRHQIYHPDYVIVLDAGLLAIGNVFAGMKDDGVAVLNTTRSPEEVKGGLTQKGARVYTVDASSISLSVYGQRAIPITNVAILGALSASTKLVKLESIMEAQKRYFNTAQQELNRKAAEMAYQSVRGLPK